MYKISKEFHFSAAHKLYGLPDDHPCSRLHGHNYIVIVHLESESLNDAGFVQDYNELKPVKDFIDKEFDHKNLNDFVFIGNTTAENIARFIYKKFKVRFPKLKAVEVRETPKTSAIYQPNV